MQLSSLSMVSRRSRRGNAALEFALCGSLLAPILAATFTIGLGLVKSIQVGQVCRNANVLVVRGVPLADPQNQTLIVKAASGLGMNTPGTWNPNPSGKGLIILSRVMRVSATECQAAGLQANNTACPNLDSYVITNRVAFGNTSLRSSAIGNPASSTDSNGDIAVSQYTTNTGNRVTSFPMDLQPGKYAYMSEAAFDISELSIFSLVAPRIYARNLS